ncbi:MAG TPA: 50S ribosomal protein L32 [Candidatus Paceibacterota bacterium]
MRHTRAHTANRRSHHALSLATGVVCECGATRNRHQMCAKCGRYRGRVVIDVAAKAAKKLEKRAQRARETGNPQSEGATAEK